MFKLCTSNTSCRPRSICLPGWCTTFGHDVWQCAVYVEAASSARHNVYVCVRDQSVCLLPQVQRQHFIPACTSRLGGSLPGRLASVCVCVCAQCL